MNEFYHAFVVGFNFWYLVAPTSFLLMFSLGYRSITFNRHTLDAYEDDIEFKGKVLAILLDVLLHLLIFFESGRGILQVLANHSDNPFYWVVVTPIAVLLSAVLVDYILYKATKLGRWMKLGYLVDVRAEISKERDEKARRARRNFSMITLEKQPGNVLNFPDNRPEIDLIK